VQNTISNLFQIGMLKMPLTIFLLTLRIFLRTVVSFKRPKVCYDSESGEVMRQEKHTCTAP
jgi:hypothetical protein